MNSNDNNKREDFAAREGPSRAAKPNIPPENLIDASEHKPLPPDNLPPDNLPPNNIPLENMPPESELDANVNAGGRIYLVGDRVEYRREKNRLRELFLPTNLTCRLCGAESFTGLPVCEECLKLMPLNDSFTCPKCGRPTFMVKICGQCREHTPLFKYGKSPLRYANESRHLVHSFKNFKPQLSDYFGDLLTGCLVGIDDVDIICYVPMTLGEWLFRGYNQSRLLANAVGVRMGLKVVPALKKVRHTKPQKTLSYTLRSENLLDAFRVKDKDAVRGKRVLLIDDIMTTTATADAVTAELLKAGAKYVIFAAVASPSDLESRPLFAQLDDEIR